MKKGDKIYLFINDRVSTCEIVEFYSSFTELKIDNKRLVVPKYHQGLFYGYGYERDNRYLFIKKLWHYYPVVLIEKIRIKFKK
jgi:hypothetical protein